MKHFLFLFISLFIFAACSNANEESSTNKENSVEQVEQTINIEDNNQAEQKDILFSNQKDNEKKHDINTSLNLSLDAYDKSNFNDFQKALVNCDEFETPSKSIIGFVDGKCQTKEIVGDKTIICNFNKEDLDIIAPFYDDNNVASSLSGNYNIDFKMDLPKIDIKESDEDNFNLNLNFALPKIKVEKTKSPAQIIIENSCK